MSLRERVAATIAFQSSHNWHEVCVPGAESRWGDRVVPNSLSEQIRECLQHAEDCARKAAELPNGSPFRQDFLQLEKRWLELARSIDFGGLCARGVAVHSIRSGSRQVLRQNL